MQPDLNGTHTHRRRKESVVGGHHGECGARVYNEGLGGRAPSGLQGQSPWSGGQGAEAESILVIGCPTEPANLAPFHRCPFELRYTQRSLTENSMLCYGPLVSELGGPECMVPPIPSLGGGLSPRTLPGFAAYAYTARNSYKLHFILCLNCFRNHI